MTPTPQHKPDCQHCLHPKAIHPPVGCQFRSWDGNEIYECDCPKYVAPRPPVNPKEPAWEIVEKLRNLGLGEIANDVLAELQKTEQEHQKEIEQMRIEIALWIKGAKEAQAQTAKGCPPHNMIPYVYIGQWGGSVPPPNAKCTKCLLTERF